MWRILLVKDSFIVTEAELLKTAVQVLGALGVRCYRRNVGARTWIDKKGKTRLMKFAMAGMADLWGTGPDGRHWEVELKRYGRKPTDEQLSWLFSMTETGAVAFWADNIRSLERVARAILAGGRIEWRRDGTYDVETCP